MLTAGTRVRVETDPREAEPLGVWAIPLDEKHWEAILVPLDDRTADKYAGYSIALSTEQLNEQFRLVE